MKFVCLSCDTVMPFAERQLPGDGTFAAVFACPSCGREIAMLANPMETQLVSSLGVQIGGRELPPQPLELTRDTVRAQRGEAQRTQDGAAVGDPAAAGASQAAGDAGAAGAARVEWSDEARARLGNVPSFVRGMVKRIYTDWARERGIARITPETMDAARADLGLEGM